MTLPLRAWIAAAFVVVAMFALFTAQLVFIVQQRQLIGSQLHVARTQSVRARPVLRAADELLGSPEQARAALRRAGDVATGLQDLLEQIRRQDLVPDTAAAMRRLPGLVADVRRSTAVLQRAYPTLRTSLRVQNHSLRVQNHSLQLQQRSLTIQARSLATQRSSLSIQRQTLELVRQTLAVARRTLAHTESLDRKTGGSPPPVLRGGR